MHIIKLAEINHFQNVISICHGNSKQLYRLSFTLLGKSYVHILPSINDDILCKTFLTFFTTKIINIIDIIEIELQSPIHLNNLQLFNHFINPHNCSLSSFCITSVQTIVHLINNCHSKSFLDPLPISLIKSLSSPLSQLILEIVHNSFITGSIHNDLKHAIVIPIIKKGNLDPESLSSYRPISQLSIISKIIEKIVFTQLSDYLIRNKLLDLYQSTYTRHHSTETAILNVFDKVLLKLSKHRPHQFLLLDLSAAFDTIDHEILIQRLIDICLCSMALQWLISFIKNRTFSIKIGNSLSNPARLTSGVPQGSVLGPLLFIISIIPISHIINKYPTIKYHLYADDIILFHEVPPLLSQHIDVISTCANELNHWLIMNKK